MWNEIADAAGAMCLVGGAGLMLSAAIGMVRFPDILARLHAASKPQSLGLILMMAGMALTVREVSVWWTAILVVLFQLITAPISAHLAARAGYRTGQVDAAGLYTDEYRKDIARALRAARRRSPDSSEGA